MVLSLHPTDVTRGDIAASRAAAWSPYNAAMRASPSVGSSVAAAWQVATCEALKANDVRTIVHVPDLVLKDLIALCESDPWFHVYAPAKEEEGVGIVCGAYLGGRRGAVLMQNSGFGNIPNVLASLAVPYQIPFLLLISQRGELNEFNPSQVGMAAVVEPVLDALNIPHFEPLHLEQVRPTIDGAARLAYGTDRPVAIVLSPYLTGGKKL
jgi:sulfopyruvate decarboxylase alpha subunit